MQFIRFKVHDRKSAAAKTAVAAACATALKFIVIHLGEFGIVYKAQLINWQGR